MTFFTPYDHSEKDVTIERLIMFFANRITYGMTFNDVLDNEKKLVAEIGTEKLWLAYKAAEVLVNKA